MKTIAIDALTVSHPLTGLGTYTGELLRRLPAHMPEARFAAVTWRSRRAELNRFIRSLEPVHPEGAPIRAVGRARMAYRLWSATGVSLLDWQLRADLSHGTTFTPLPTNRGRRVITILDLVSIRFPQWMPDRSGFAKRELQRHAASADVVITISEFVKGEVVEYLGIPEDRVVATPLGVRQSLLAGGATTPPDARLRAIRERYAAGRPFVLYVGTLDPRKNVPALIRAYDRMRRAHPHLEHALVLAGRFGWGTDEVRETWQAARFRQHIYLTDYVPEEDLPLLYAAADLFVFPSWYEGFGLPPLEAMAAGCPVVAGSGGSLPEVVGDAAVVIDPMRAEAELAEHMPRLLEDDAERARLRAAGRKRVQRFSWDDTARRTADAYRQAWAS
jgi:glycosyltransferase involved in cell wall biosynthesis